MNLSFQDVKKPAGLFLVVAAVVGGILVPMFRAESEVPARDYHYLRDRLSDIPACPGLADEVKIASRDGRITRQEFTSISFNTAPCEIAKAKGKLTAYTGTVATAPSRPQPQ